MTHVSLRGLTKDYPNGFRAVDGLSLDIDHGEMLVVVGPSGCGKSTTLRMVAGLETITSGEMLLDGRDVTTASPRQRDVAMVFQNYALYPHMTAAENIGYPLRVAGVPKVERRDRVVEAARLLQLDDELDKRPNQLSGGQRQRVAMGRALVRQPRLFLLDEPLSNLDAKLRVQMRGGITSLQRKLDVTALYVTHDQVEAMTMADRVAVMHRGILQQVSPPRELFDNPRNLFVASFIGSPSMNLVTARIERIHERLCAIAGTLTLPIPPGVLTARPRLAQYTNRDVALGLRPTDLRNAQPHPASREVHEATVRVEAVEVPGAEQIVYFCLDAAPVEVEGAPSSADGGESAARPRQTLTRMAARFEPGCRVVVGSDTRIQIDTRRAHFFDLDSGFAIDA